MFHTRLLLWFTCLISSHSLCASDTNLPIPQLSPTDIPVIHSWPPQSYTPLTFEEYITTIKRFLTHDLIDKASPASKFDQAHYAAYFDRYVLDKNTPQMLRVASSIQRAASLTAILIYDATSNHIVKIVDLGHQEITPAFNQCDDYRNKGCDFRDHVLLDFTGFPVGAYYAVLIGNDGGASGPIFFSLRGPWPLVSKMFDVMVVYPTFTWDAYNSTGGASFYTDDASFLYQISTSRPDDNRVLVDYHNARATIPFVRFLREKGYSVLEVASEDLHENPNLFSAAQVILLNGHDEYWSVQMRENFDSFVSLGGKLAVFGGNTAWWQIEVSNANLFVSKRDKQAQGIYKDTGRGFANWINNPIVSLLGQTYLFGGYSLTTYLQKEQLPKYFISSKDLELSRTIEVVEAGHQIFSGLNLHRGDRFGGASDIVFSEVDGLPLRGDGKVDFGLYPAVPRDVKVLATALVFNANLPNTAHTPPGRLSATSVITELVNGNGGQVLHFGSMGWYRAVAVRDEVAIKVIENALDYMLGESPDAFPVSSVTKNLRDTFPLGQEYEEIAEIQDLRLRYRKGDDQAGLQLASLLLKPAAPGSDTFVEISLLLNRMLKIQDPIAQGLALKVLSMAGNGMSINPNLDDAHPIFRIVALDGYADLELAEKSLELYASDSPFDQLVSQTIRNFSALAAGEVLDASDCLALNIPGAENLPPVSYAYFDCLYRTNSISLEELSARLAQLPDAPAASQAKLNRIDAIIRQGGVSDGDVLNLLKDVRSEAPTQANVRLVDHALSTAENIYQLASIADATRELAHAGYGNAVFVEGVLMEYGIGLQQDISGAIDAYRLAGERGHGPGRDRARLLIDRIGD